MELDDLRSQIDAIDLQILDLLNKRAHLAIQIGIQKNRLNIPVKNLQREQQILNKLKNNNKGPLSNSQLSRIFKIIITACRQLQQND